MNQKKNILLPLAAVCICLFFFGIYGHFEFANQAKSERKFAKHWSGMGAAYTGKMIGRLADPRYVWEREYECLETDAKRRFTLKNIRTDVQICLPKYLSSIF